ncbi:MAG: formylglycine-generating enzyme family protein [Parvularculaceae bacterium]
MYDFLSGKRMRNLFPAILLASVCACHPGRAEPHSCAGGDQIGEEVFIQGGAFIFGSNDFYPEERPASVVSVEDFWIDRTEVTNGQFSAFVAATGYITQAEKGLDVKSFPEVAPEFRVPGSMVFALPATLENASPLTWWRFTPGADWRHPFGPDSNISGREDYPVVHVTHADAQAYADWSGRRLPSEKEWEYAARAGAPELPEHERPLEPKSANFWQGVFPILDTGEDGFKGMSPAGCFEANGYGLFDMIGNVWELTGDIYRPTHAPMTVENLSSGRNEPGQADYPAYVIKGGSYLCATSFCARYRPDARQPMDAYLGSSHTGFRTAR